MIRKYATSCIDTSDGAFLAAAEICEMSGVGMELSNIPYHQAGATIAKWLSMPKEMLFFCECGEYELLFTSPDPNLQLHKIGRVVEKGMTLDNKDITHMKISARSFSDMKSYVKAVKDQCGAL